MNKHHNTKQQGFTLIELVIVIVILGILAATAAPKFMNLTGDATKAVMQGVQGSISSAVAMAHSKALIAGETKSTGHIKIGTKFYKLVYGYPAALGGNGTTANNGFGIKDFLDLGADITLPTTTPAVFSHSKATTPASCKVSYSNSTGNLIPPVVTSTLTGC